MLGRPAPTDSLFVCGMMCGGTCKHKHSCSAWHTCLSSGPGQASKFLWRDSACWYYGAYAVLGDMHSCSISQNVYLHSAQQAHVVGLVRALLISLNCWCPTDIGVLTQSPSDVA